MSLELWSLTQSYLDLTLNYVALPVRRGIAQSNGKRLMCPREASHALACMLNLYCLKYNYKFILIFYETLYVYVKSILCK